jgi:hypothetical protein
MIKKIDALIVDAMRVKDKDRLKVLRSLKTALKYQEIEQKKPLTEEECIYVLQSQIKGREQAIELYLQGNRPELAAQEQYEIKVIRSFLPAALSLDELTIEVEIVINELGAASIKDMGPVMQALRQKLGSKADGKILSQLVKAKLQA